MACFATNLQKYIHISKYARWIEKEKRRETWEESVARLMEFWREKNTVPNGIGDAIYDMSILDKIEKAILDCDIMPSMRGMMTAGKALHRDNIALYNCTASAIMHPAIFSEAFYILMNGCGFGFSCERQYINQMPDIAEEFYESTTKLDIRDSKIGWATGLKELISMLYNGQIPKWDLSKIRPAGARLKTFGGRASGKAPLNKLFKHTVKLFTNAKGRKLNSIECHDLMCHIADTVIVGSVRRAALISLSNLTDDRMRRAKDGQWWLATPHRALANNSVAYTEKPDIDSFSKEWRTLYKSKSGERGIWNKVSAKFIAEARGREHDGDYIPNPCVTGDTKILTDNGYVEIASIVDKEVNVWNGVQWSPTTPTITGHNREIIEIDFSNGMSLKCTKNHKFILPDGNRVSAEDIQEGTKLTKFNFPIIYGEKYIDDDKMYTQGFYSGDGNTDSNIIRLYDDKCDLLEHLGVTNINDISTKSNKIISTRFEKLFDKSFVPGGNYTLRNRLSWLGGIIDSDGCSLKDGSVQIWSIDYNFLKNIIYMIHTMGSTANLSIGKPEQHKFMPDGKGSYKEYKCKECWRISISGSNILKLKEIGLSTNRVDISYIPQREASRFIKIINKEDVVERADKVYCFTEKFRHSGVFNGLLTGQCGEVSLRDNGGVCNLTEQIIRENDTFKTICRKTRLATIMGTIQATLTDFRFLRKIWKRNCEEERLLGVSMTGIMDHRVFSNNATKEEFIEWSSGKFDNLPDLLDYLHDYAHKINKEWAKKLGINSTGHVCVIKPSGTVSILTGTSSGIHPRYGKFYIRRVRNDKKDPLSQLMINQGVPYVDEDDKYVFTFYVKSPDHSVIQKDIGAIKQLELWKIYKEHWCDGNPSQTIYYTDDDYFAVADWLWTNWDLVGGLSFFPYTDASEGVYTNAPLEEITEEEYLAGEASFPKEIEWDRLVEFEEEDTTTSSQEFSCVAGACELVDHNG